MTSTSPTRTIPARGSNLPLSTHASVDFPDPEGSDDAQQIAWMQVETDMPEKRHRVIRIAMCDVVDADSDLPVAAARGVVS